jgi:hypothetical protein
MRLREKTSTSTLDPGWPLMKNPMKKIKENKIKREENDAFAVLERENDARFQIQ